MFKQKSVKKGRYEISKKQKMQFTERGITLIALVITIIVLLILAGVSISMITGDNGILNRAGEASFKSEMSAIKEELEMYKAQKTMENLDFEAGTLYASNQDGSLYYNTKPTSEKGNIKTILPSANQNYLDNIEIITGEIVYKTTDMTEIGWLEDIGIQINPYNITEDGTLISSNSNLALMDENTGTLVLPSTVKKIGAGACANVSGLKTIIIPGRVKEIEADAFSYNTDLETVIMEDGVEIIGPRAFQACISLTTIEMPNSITQIGREAFLTNRKLSNVTLSNGLLVIPGGCFQGCNSLQEINIPEGVTELQGASFSSCSSLTTVNIPSSVTTIGDTAFNGDGNLTNINIAEGNTNFTFSNGVLLGDNGTTIKIILESAIDGNTFTVPDGVTTLSNYQLNAFSNATSVKIPASVTSLAPLFITRYITDVEIDSNNTSYVADGKAIYTPDRKTLVRYYGSDTEVELSEGLTTIGIKAFFSTKITSIKLPETLEVIGSYAFQDCGQLKSLSLGKNVRSIGALFLYSSTVENITIDEENHNYSIVNGALCNYDGTVFMYPVKPEGTITSYEIPYGVTEIGGYAFHNQYNMTSVTIPNTVTKINTSFNYCGSLTKIEIPSSVNEISSDAFENSQDLTEILIHKSSGSISGSPWGATQGEKAVKWLGE